MCQFPKPRYRMYRYQEIKRVLFSLYLERNRSQIQKINNEAWNYFFAMIDLCMVDPIQQQSRTSHCICIGSQGPGSIFGCCQGRSPRVVPITYLCMYIVPYKESATSLVFLKVLPT